MTREKQRTHACTPFFVLCRASDTIHVHERTPSLVGWLVRPRWPRYPSHRLHQHEQPSFAVVLPPRSLKSFIQNGLRMAPHSVLVRRRRRRRFRLSRTTSIRYLSYARIAGPSTTLGWHIIPRRRLMCIWYTCAQCFTMGTRTQHRTLTLCERIPHEKKQPARNMHAALRAQLKPHTRSASDIIIRAISGQQLQPTNTAGKHKKDCQLGNFFDCVAAHKT